MFTNISQDLANLADNLSLEKITPEDAVKELHALCGIAERNEMNVGFAVKALHDCAIREALEHLTTQAPRGIITEEDEEEAEDELHLGSDRLDDSPATDWVA